MTENDRVRLLRRAEGRAHNVVYLFFCLLWLGAGALVLEFGSWLLSNQWPTWAQFGFGPTGIPASGVGQIAQWLCRLTPSATFLILGYAGFQFGPHKWTRAKKSLADAIDESAGGAYS